MRRSRVIACFASSTQQMNSLRARGVMSLQAASAAELASTLGHRKATHLSQARPDVVVTSNPGCILQIRAAARDAGFAYRVLHIAEILDRSISAGAGVTARD